MTKPVQPPESYMQGYMGGRAEALESLKENVTPEMVAAGMQAWDAQHKAGVRDWPTMLAEVFRAMLAEREKGGE